MQIYLNINDIYETQCKYENAIKIFEKDLEILKKTGEEYSLEAAKVNIFFIKYIILIK